MTDSTDTADSTAAKLRNDPIDSTENADPIEPIDPTDPTLPTDNTDPVLPTDNTELRERMLSTDPLDARPLPMPQL